MCSVVFSEFLTSCLIEVCQGFDTLDKGSSLFHNSASLDIVQADVPKKNEMFLIARPILGPDCDKGVVQSVA